MSDDKMPSIADLIAQTPGSQPLDQALASVAARRARLLGQDRPEAAAGGTADEAAPPPEPHDWAERYTDPAAVKSVLDALQPKPAQPFKPTLVVDNEKPDPPGGKPPKRPGR